MGVEVQLFALSLPPSLDGVDDQRHAQATLTPPPMERPSIHCIGGWVGLRASLENLTLSGIRSPDRPAHSKSLYQLRYPGSLKYTYIYTYNPNIFAPLC